MNRLKRSLKEEKKALIPFLMAGDPDLDTTLELMLLLAEEGAGAIELGVPFSDPVADGPVIQAASDRALARGVRLPDVLELGRRFRERNDTVPLILFSYANPLLQYGLGRLAEECVSCGFDGWIVPDLPAEECGDWKHLARSRGLALIPLVAPTSGERIRLIASEAEGFVYCVSSLGTTGERTRFHDRLESLVKEVRQTTSVPVAVGFGVSTGEQVAGLKRFADAVVVGSALVNRIAGLAPLFGDEVRRGEAFGSVRAFVRELESE
jgi:tryptophan synthase alpha chain